MTFGRRDGSVCHLAVGGVGKAGSWDRVVAKTWSVIRKRGARAEGYPCSGSIDVQGKPATRREEK